MKNKAHNRPRINDLIVALTLTLTFFGCSPVMGPPVNLVSISEIQRELALIQAMDNAAKSLQSYMKGIPSQSQQVEKEIRTSIDAYHVYYTTMEIYLAQGNIEMFDLYLEAARGQLKKMMGLLFPLL